MLNFRKPCSDHKLKEMTGSGIFAAQQENDDQEVEGANATPSNKTGLRMYQVYRSVAASCSNYLCIHIILKGVIYKNAHLVNHHHRHGY